LPLRQCFCVFDPYLCFFANGRESPAIVFVSSPIDTPRMQASLRFSLIKFSTKTVGAILTHSNCIPLNLIPKITNNH
jgi:hypothetical protein